MKYSLTINEIKQSIKMNGYSVEVLSILQSDKRQGVKVLLDNYYKHMEQEKKQKENYEKKLYYEKRLFDKGFALIAGMDEAGRGPLAGPVIAASVILPKDFYLAGLDDSKQLTKKKREAYFELIREKAVSYGIGIIHNEEIDRINIFQATKAAMHQAVSKMDVPANHILIDAVEIENLPCSSTSIIKGDQKSVSIAAASVLAKVTRDNWMIAAAKEFPVYGFDKNMGYGTKHHLAALEKYGPSPYHRFSFAPVRENLK